MSEIVPTSAASVLANQLAAPAVPLLPPGLPATLPVQIITLPPDLAQPAPQNPAGIAGALQLLPNGQATLQTAAGAVTLALPQVRGNPALLQAIKHYLSEHNSVTLQLQTAPGAATPTAQLVFAAVAAGVGRDLAQAAPSLASGQTLPALVLPAEKTDAQAAALSSAASPGNRAGAASGGLSHQQKLETWLQQWLGASAPRATQPAEPQPLQGRLTEATKSLHMPLAVTVQLVLLPGQAAPALRADQILARVLRPSATGEALLVNAGDVNLLLKTGQTVPAGSNLILKLQPPRAAEAQPIAAPAESGWPALHELLNGLQAGTLQAGGAWQNFMQHRVPRPDNALAGALLVMLSAMRQQDPRAWLGKDNATALEQGGRKPLLEALQQELQQKGGTTSDATVGEWRVYQLPLLDQQHILPLQVYVHHNQQQRDSGQGQAAASQEQAQQTRFVIDVTFSRLGAMQLDGFVRPQQFDLVLRTAQPLAPGLQQELQAAFQSATMATGYQGQMLFQTGRQHWLQLAPQTHGSRQV